ncbi:MAG: hypothetical protein BGO29_05900 [Bacteroidales bacterium 36-12]|nr:MAG: hypothetical protein BGO29_05900 [Bacteroidales bacterium 36-12]
MKKTTLKLKIPAKLAPYQGVFIFFVTLFVANYFWKFTMIGDESDDVVTFFGIDLSSAFNFMSAHVAKVVFGFMRFVGYSIQLDELSNIVSHDNNIAVRIVWACTGYKQAYIFTVIMLFAKGSFVRKLWYIPSGLVVVYLFNIFRIIMIVAAIKENPSSFEFLHERFYKYLFYGIIFLMWMLWEEKLSGRKKTD